MNKRVTIRDIAKVAGVTHGTVSRALRGSPLVRSQTRERIISIARIMGYRTDRIAQSLKEKRTKTIGLVVPDISNPFFGASACGVQEKARELGYHIILGSTGRNLDEEAIEIEFLRERMVDGLIICPVSQGSSRHLKALTGEIPFVLLASRVQDLEADYVASDDVRGGYLATRHLITLGHRRIAHISDPPDTSQGEDRAAGYRKALTEANIIIDEGLIIRGDASIDSGYAAAKELLGMSSSPTAVFAANDLTAIGVLTFAKERGIAVPEEVALVGYDDIQMAEYVEPPLTTVAQDKRALGVQAMEMLWEKLRCWGKEPSAPGSHRIVLEPTLVVRATTIQVDRGRTVQDRLPWISPSG